MAGKSDSLQRKLLEDIRNGVLKPGQAIPSRNQLCRKYQISRTTVDRAINRLLEAGYLSANQGSRTYVRQADPDSSLKQLYIVYQWPWTSPNLSGEHFFNPLSCPLPLTGIGGNDVGMNYAKLAAPGSAVIWDSPSMNALYFMESLANAGVPQIMINRDYTGFNYVATDPRASLREGLAWMLIEAGREITLLTRPNDHTRPYMAERTIAFYETAIELGAKLTGGSIFSRNVHNIPHEIAAIAHELFLGVKPARGIVILNQEFAIPLVSCGMALGKQPGRDYFLLMFDYYDELKNYHGIGMMRQQRELMRSETLRWLTGGYAERRDPFHHKIKTELLICS